MKRWGKSPPLRAQARRHGKPHRVQGQIGDPGAARSSSRESGMGPGYWLLRQMILSSGFTRGRQNSAYSPSKIRSLPLCLFHGRGTCFSAAVNSRHSNYVWQVSRPGTLTLRARQHFRLPFAALPVLKYPEPRGLRAAGKPVDA